MGFVFLFCIHCVFANSIKCIVMLCENLILHVFVDSMILIYLVRPYKLNHNHMSNRCASYAPFLCRVVYLNGLCSTSKPLHIYQCEVEGPLLASEFFWCLQVQWRQLGIDLGTRQLVFTTVIDRWSQGSGLQSYWCLSQLLLAASRAIGLPPAWSCCWVCVHLCLCVCVSVYILTGHTC